MRAWHCVAHDKGKLLTRKSLDFCGDASRLQLFVKQGDLRALSRSVEAFDDNEGTSFIYFLHAEIRYLRLGVGSKADVS